MKRITVIGRAAAAPEVRSTNTGIQVAEVRLAVTPRYMDKKTNEWKDGTTEWFNVVVWDRKVAKVAGIDKGMSVFVEGDLSTRAYEKKDGSKGFSVEIKADQIFPIQKTNAPQATERAETQDFASEEIPF